MTAWKWLLAALACALVGCSGSGSGPPGGDDVVSVAQERLVVQLDVNGDNAPDVLTLDTSKTPFRIVEALEGTVGGAPVDATAILGGQPIDAEISRALADYLAASFAVGTRTELDVRDVNDQLVTLVIFE
ncbi:MAG: hypothetical protein ACYTEZ_18350 [Planctomycetota bacterium]|jgi:hypothetical protein